jgi:hypothetical protein
MNPICRRPVRVGAWLVVMSVRVVGVPQSAKSRNDRQRGSGIQLRIDPLRTWPDIEEMRAEIMPSVEKPVSSFATFMLAGLRSRRLRP